MTRLSDLSKWQRELAAEREAIDRDLKPLLDQREQLRSKLELVTRLLALENGHLDSPQSRTGRDETATPDVPSVASELQAAVHQVLEAAGAPMHVSAINAALRQRGVTVPGKGTDANIIVHLRRAPDVFERMARGTYALTAWKKGRAIKLGGAR